MDIKALADPGDQLIFLQMCWDGADMFNYSGKSMWPVLYCIMNLPPALRKKVHIGMHMASFDEGSDAALDIFFKELSLLWDPGFTINCRRVRVVLVDCLMDSRGREKFVKCQGACSHAGCNRCYFAGRSFGGSVVYEGVRRHLPLLHAMRRVRKARGAPLQVGCHALHVSLLLY
jgi:hypothetical protein